MPYKKMKAYIAAGWFTLSQEERRLQILHALRTTGIDFYSPKDDMLYVEGGIKSEAAFSENIIQINNCSFMVASTEGKDMGTIFECGYAFAMKRPIVYYWGGTGKFNIMLAESAHAVIQTRGELINYLGSCRDAGKVVKIPYSGRME